MTTEQDVLDAVRRIDRRQREITPAAVAAELGLSDRDEKLREYLTRLVTVGLIETVTETDQDIVPTIFRLTT